MGHNSHSFFPQFHGCVFVKQLQVISDLIKSGRNQTFNRYPPGLPLQPLENRLDAVDLKGSREFFTLALHQAVELLQPLKELHLKLDWL